MSEYGDFITKKRIELGYTLRRFCLEFGYDCGNWSRHERGLSNPFSPNSSAFNKLSDDLKLGCLERVHLEELAEKELWPDKCKVRELLSEIQQLQARLKEAESVIDAVYNVDTMQIDKDEYDYKLESQEVFRITGEYKQKYIDKE